VAIGDTHFDELANAFIVNMVVRDGERDPLGRLASQLLLKPVDVVRSSSRNPCHSSPQLPGGFHTLTILSMPLEKSVPSGVRHRLATVSRWPPDLLVVLEHPDGPFMTDQSPPALMLVLARTHLIRDAIIGQSCPAMAVYGHGQPQPSTA
jgi:hypothetical protein